MENSVGIVATTFFVKQHGSLDGFEVFVVECVLVDKVVSRRFKDDSVDSCACKRMLDNKGLDVDDGKFWTVEKENVIAKLTLGAGFVEEAVAGDLSSKHSDFNRQSHICNVSWCGNTSVQFGLILFPLSLQHLL